MKHFTFLLIFFGAKIGFSQNHNFGLAISSGFVSSNFHSSKGNLFQNNFDANNSYYLGINIDRKLSEKISISAGLRYIRLGAKISFTAYDSVQNKIIHVDKTQIIKTQNLQIPVNLDFLLYNSGISLNLGYVIGGILSGNKYNNYIKDSEIKYEKHSIDDISNYPFINSRLIRINHAISLGLNYKIPFTQIIYLNLNYVSNFSKIYEMDEIKNHYVLLGLKYTIPKKKT